MMFCFCCNPSTPLSASRFFAEGLTEDSSDVTRALQRRAAYERRKAYTRAPVSHPGRIEMIIRGVRALATDGRAGDCAVMDIHVRNGEIVDIGRQIQADAMLEVDGQGLVALPGLIADRSHLVIDAARPDADQVENEHVYRIARLALLDLMSAGVTSVDQCACNIPTARAEMALLAQIDAGLRGRFGYPLSDGDEPDDMMAELAERWPLEASDDRVQVRSPAPVCDAAAEARADSDGSACLMDAAVRLERDRSAGSLVAGEPADFILVDPARSQGQLDPYPATWSAGDIHAGNVVLVCVDGRLRKRNGVIVEPNEGLIRKEGREALMASRRPANH